VSAELSDGTTTITLSEAWETPVPRIDRSVNVSAGGSLKAQVSGERLALEVRAAVSAADYRSLLSMLTAPAEGFSYKPSRDLSSLYPGLPERPQVDVDGLEATTDAGGTFYVKMTVRGVDYL
jgi:hypothetical protein